MDKDALKGIPKTIDNIMGTVNGDIKKELSYYYCYALDVGAAQVITAVSRELVDNATKLDKQVKEKIEYLQHKPGYCEKREFEKDFAAVQWQNKMLKEDAGLGNKVSQCVSH